METTSQKCPFWLKNTTPRGAELKSVNNDSNITCNSNPVKRWPKSGTDSAKTPKISSELEGIIKIWPELPEHVKKTICTLVSVTRKEKSL